jgi:hypothetical protein
MSIALAAAILKSLLLTTSEIGVETPEESEEIS